MLHVYEKQKTAEICFVVAYMSFLWWIRKWLNTVSRANVMGTNGIGSFIALITNYLNIYFPLSNLDWISASSCTHLYESCSHASIILTDRNSCLNRKGEKKCYYRINVSTNKMWKGYRKAYYFVSQGKNR